jgi:dTMP kinase
VAPVVPEPHGAEQGPGRGSDTDSDTDSGRDSRQGSDQGSAEGGHDAPTAELPAPQPGTARDDDPADRVPPWLFRPQDGTRETSSPAARRPRPEWAEETPLDDLPSLADELLGPHDEGDEPRGR